MDEGDTLPFMNPVAETLIANLNAFTGFVRSRIGETHVAEDVVQDSLAKALASANQPSGEENTVAWFYRILRHSIVDLYRRDAARKRAMEAFGREWPETPDAEAEKQICQCFKRLLPAIPDQYQALLQRIDLDGEDSGAVAEELGLTRNNLTVRLHRARQRLHDELSRTCRTCAKHGCLDCTCDDGPAPKPRL